MKRPQEVQVVDFFSGCGGTSYGFATATTKNLRFRICGALDVDAHANATFARMLGVQPLEQEIQNVARSERSIAKLRATWKLDARAPLIVLGCAPCQGFSSHRKKDSRIDGRNTLLSDFGKVIVGLDPDLVVMENVPEMLRAEHWEHFEAWKRTLERAGYTVRTQIHNLAHFGVPQERFRALVIAARDWKFFSLPSASHSFDHFVTVRDAIGHLPPLLSGATDPVDPMHQTSRHRAETIERIMMVPRDGGSRRSLPSSAVPGCLTRVDGFRDVYGRLAWDKPAVAITARCRTPSCGRFTHPEQHRGLSVREAALLQGFPSEYHFEGPFDDKFKQVGNAVSPMFSRAIALHLDAEWVRDHACWRPDAACTHDIRVPFHKSFSSSIAGIKRQTRTNVDSVPVQIS